MKSRGVNLEKHYDQMFNYWSHVVPRRPPFVILCNFAEFLTFDFNQQLFNPVERLLLCDLPQSGAALNFLLPHLQKPMFGNNRVEVTRKAGDTFAEVFRQIVARGQNRTRAQRFILKLLVMPQAIARVFPGQSSPDGLDRWRESNRGYPASLEETFASSPASSPWLP